MLLTFSTGKSKGVYEKVPKEWTGNLVGLMHTHRISNKMLADHLGVSEQYTSMVLNGHREPEGAEQRFREAVGDLIRKQEQDAS